MLLRRFAAGVPVEEKNAGLLFPSPSSSVFQGSQEEFNSSFCN
jgi:hypothetical protein